MQIHFDIDDPIMACRVDLRVDVSKWEREWKSGWEWIGVDFIDEQKEVRSP